MASGDPAVDSGLKAVSLLKRHSLLACNTTPAASIEGSILLCNDYRHASPPARFRDEHVLATSHSVAAINLISISLVISKINIESLIRFIITFISLLKIKYS